MNCKNILLVAIASAFLMGCDPQEDMESNPLRAKAHDIEKNQERDGREQETKYGKSISKSFKKQPD